MPPLPPPGAPPTGAPPGTAAANKGSGGAGSGVPGWSGAARIAALEARRLKQAEQHSPSHERQYAQKARALRTRAGYLRQQAKDVGLKIRTLEVQLRVARKAASAKPPSSAKAAATKTAKTAKAAAKSKVHTTKAKASKAKKSTTHTKKAVSKASAARASAQLKVHSITKQIATLRQRQHALNQEANHLLFQANVMSPQKAKLVNPQEWTVSKQALARVLALANLPGSAPGRGWSDIARLHALEERKLKEKLHFKPDMHGNLTAHAPDGRQVGHISNTPSPDTPNKPAYYATHGKLGDTHNNGGVGHEGPGALAHAKQELQAAHDAHLAGATEVPRPVQRPLPPQTRIPPDVYRRQMEQARAAGAQAHQEHLQRMEQIGKQADAAHAKQVGRLTRAQRAEYDRRTGGGMAKHQALYEARQVRGRSKAAEPRLGTAAEVAPASAVTPIHETVARRLDRTAASAHGDTQFHLQEAARHVREGNLGQAKLLVGRANSDINALAPRGGHSPRSPEGATQQRLAGHLADINDLPRETRTRSGKAPKVDTRQPQEYNRGMDKSRQAEFDRLKGKYASSIRSWQRSEGADATHHLRQAQLHAADLQRMGAHLDSDTGQWHVGEAPAPSNLTKEEERDRAAISGGPSEASIAPGQYHVKSGARMGKAHMIVEEGGHGTYVNSRGERKPLTAAQVAKNHASGMSHLHTLEHSSNEPTAPGGPVPSGRAPGEMVETRRPSGGTSAPSGGGGYNPQVIQEGIPGRPSEREQRALATLQARRAAAGQPVGKNAYQAQHGIFAGENKRTGKLETAYLRAHTDSELQAAREASQARMQSPHFGPGPEFKKEMNRHDSIVREQHRRTAVSSGLPKELHAGYVKYRMQGFSHDQAQVEAGRMQAFRAREARRTLSSASAARQRERGTRSGGRYKAFGPTMPISRA